MVYKPYPKLVLIDKVNGKKATEIGVADYIEKPLAKRDLALIVRQVLDSK